MGRWEEPSDDVYADTIAKLGPRVELTYTKLGYILDTLSQAGLIVRAPYYVPDPDELLGQMKTWQYHISAGTDGCRWVMCRETIDALARKYARQVTPMPITFNADFWRTDGADLPAAALEMDVRRVIESRTHWSAQDMLFGVPIRVDPAARSPLFEIDTDATRAAP